MSRRRFLLQGSGLMAATALVTHSCSSPGPNQRVGVGIVGCGERAGQLLLDQFSKPGCEGLFEIVALCDVWRVNLEQTAKAIQERTGKRPKTFARYQDLLAMPEVDAVVIAVPDFMHCQIAIDAANSGKHVYIEKPLAHRVEDAVAVRDAVLKHGVVAQMGTGMRSSGVMKTCAECVQSGKLGNITKIEVAWCCNEQRWLRDLSDCRQEDVDWDQFQQILPEKRPFDAKRLRIWRFYRDYTTGIMGLMGSHLVDVCNWFLQRPLPMSVVARGGVYVWKDDGRETPDTFEAILEYPGGCLVTCSLMLGSGPEWPGLRVRGTKFNLDTRGCRLTESGSYPIEKEVTELPLLEDESHVGVWLQSIQGSRKPNADIHAGFNHAVASILASEAQVRGKCLRYDEETQTIVEA